VNKQFYTGVIKVCEYIISEIWTFRISPLQLIHWHDYKWTRFAYPAVMWHRRETDPQRYHTQCDSLNSSTASFKTSSESWKPRHL